MAKSLSITSNPALNKTPTANDYIDLHFFIRDLPEYSDVIDIYLKILDKTKADIPYDLQKYYLKNSGRLGLTGKFLPISSNLFLKNI